MNSITGPSSTSSHPLPLARVFCPFFPYPGNSGASQVVIGDVDLLLRDYRVELVTWFNSSEEIERLVATPAIDQLPKAVRIIKVDTAFSTSPISRFTRVLSSIFSRYSSTEQYFYPRILAPPQLERADLEVFHSSLCLSWLLRNYFVRSLKRVAYFHNIEASLIEQRAFAETNLLKRLLLHLNAKKLFRNERQVVSEVDETWFVSASDLSFAQKKLSCANGRLKVPRFTEHLKTERLMARAKRTPTARYTFGLLGTLDFKPNIDSALFVLDSICPAIKASGYNCEIIIAGKKPPAEIVTLASKFDFVKLTGFIEDIETFWPSIDCMLVPHISGSGIRIKMLEALSSGVEVIANEPAAAALPKDFHAPGLTVVSTEKFTDAVIKRLS